MREKGAELGGFALALARSGPPLNALMELRMSKTAKVKCPTDYTQTMRSVGRVMSLLECFTAARHSLSLHEIALQVKLSDATTLRLLRSLVQLGYLVRRQDQQYCLSIKILQLASGVKESMTAWELSRDILPDIVRTTGEGVGLHTIDRYDRVVVEFVSSEAELRSIVHVGDRGSLIVGASGKVLLAFQPPHLRKAIVDKALSRKPKQKRELEAQLNRIRRRGYGESFGEVTLGSVSISFPIFERDGTVKYCLSLFGPEGRMLAHRAEVTDILRNSANAISERNGWMRAEVS